MSLRGNGSHDALHLLGRQTQTLDQRHVAVTERGRIAAVGRNPIADVGTNRPIASVIRIHRTGLHRRGDGRHGCSGAAPGKGSGAGTKGFQGGRIVGWDDRRCRARFDGSGLEAVLEGVRIQAGPNRRSTGERQGTDGGQQTCNATLLGVVGHHGNVRLTLEDLHGEHGQRSFRPDFDKQTATGIVHGLDLLRPLHR